MRSLLLLRFRNGIRTCFPVLACAALLPLAAAFAQDSSEPLSALEDGADTTVGEVRSVGVKVGYASTIRARQVSHVALADGALADIKVLHELNQIVLIGKQAGVTNLFVWAGPEVRRHYRVTVEDPARDAARRAVVAELSAMENISVRSEADRILVSGRALTVNDFQKIKAIEQRMPGLVNSVTPPTIDLKGTVLLDVTVLEVRRNRMREIGINWQDSIAGPNGGFVGDFVTNDLFRGPSIGGATLPLDAGSSNAFFGIATGITSAINLLMQDGTARLLAQPKLTCVSGGTAEFLVGGEVPIPVTNAVGSSNVTYKQFGIVLEMEPVADAEGFIDTRLSVEVSAIDASATFQGLPGFSSRRADTRMNVRQNQTMVIAGLTNSELSKNVDKIPLLGNIPILGELFKSRAFRNNETELVVFVTPSLYAAESQRNQQELARAATLRKTAEDEIRKFDIWD